MNAKLWHFDPQQLEQETVPTASVEQSNSEATQQVLGGRLKPKPILEFQRPVPFQTHLEDAASSIAPIRRHPFARRKVSARVEVLQKWEGYVEEIGEETFTARLVDKSGTEPEQQAELLISDVAIDDRDLLVAGGVFYWTIGYRNDVCGGLRRTSSLRFRRLPAWSQKELSKAREQAAEAFAALGWGE